MNHCNPPKWATSLAEAVFNYLHDLEGSASVSDIEDILTEYMEGEEIEDLMRWALEHHEHYKWQAYQLSTWLKQAKIDMPKHIQDCLEAKP